MLLVFDMKIDSDHIAMSTGSKIYVVLLGSMIVIFDNPHQNGLFVLCCDVFCIVFIISLSIGMLKCSGHLVGRSCN